MSKKRGRPFAANPAELQERVGTLQGTIDELSSQNVTLAANAEEAITALASARSLLGRAVELMQAQPTEDLASTHIRELSAAGLWYARHSPADRAELLMQPHALEQEYRRFCLWMPRYMLYLARMLITRRKGTSSDPDHPGHDRWLRAQQVLLHSTATKTLRARSKKCIPLLTLSKWLDRFYKHARTGLEREELKLGKGLHHSVIANLRDELVSYVPRVPYVQMKSIRLLYLDNWDMYRHVTHATLKGGESKKSTMLHAIIIAEEVMDASLFSDPAPAGTLFNPRAESTWSPVGSLPNQDEVTAHLGNYFTGMMLVALDDVKVLWERPHGACDSQTSGKSVMVSHPVQADLCTSSKEDMAEMFQRLDMQLGPDCYKLL
jgi:hypothetical protein